MMVLIRPEHKKPERGAAMVELALTLMPFLIFLFAIIDFGMAIFIQNTAQAAARAGARYAITSQFQTVSGSSLGQDQSVKNVVKTESMGFLTYLIPLGHTLDQHIAITYYDQTTLAPVTGLNSNRGGNIVQVSIIGLSYAWMVPLVRTSGLFPIVASSADAMEASPVSGPPGR